MIKIDDKEVNVEYRSDNKEEAEIEIMAELGVVITVVGSLFDMPALEILELQKKLIEEAQKLREGGK